MYPKIIPADTAVAAAFCTHRYCCTPVTIFVGTVVTSVDNRLHWLERVGEQTEGQGENWPAATAASVCYCPSRIRRQLYSARVGPAWEIKNSDNHIFLQKKL